MRFIALTLSFLILTFTTPALASYEDGLTAYQQKDWFNAIRNLRPLAEENDDRALVLLGNMYNDGNGVPKNSKTAFEHYKRALINNNNNAMVAIATMYAQGMGVEKDFKTGFNWFKKSAEYGNSAGQIMFASILIKGHPELPELEPNPQHAYAWYRIVELNATEASFKKLGTELGKRLSSQLTPDQIVNAEKFAKNWQPVSTETETKETKNKEQE